MDHKIHIQVWESDEANPRLMACLSTLKLGKLLGSGHSDIGRIQRHESICVTKGKGTFGSDVIFRELASGASVEIPLTGDISI
ncbi:hypothetical protein ABC733_17265 [Mangrovibacter sp. SLW1]